MSRVPSTSRDTSHFPRIVSSTKASAQNCFDYDMCNYCHWDSATLSLETVPLPRFWHSVCVRALKDKLLPSFKGNLSFQREAKNRKFAPKLGANVLAHFAIRLGKNVKITKHWLQIGLMPTARIMLGR